MSEPTAVMTNAAPQLSVGRILRALLAGACTGSLLTTGGIFLGADPSTPGVTLLFTFPYVLVATFVAFSVGIVALGVPGWWIAPARLPELARSLGAGHGPHLHRQGSDGGPSPDLARTELRLLGRR